MRVKDLVEMLFGGTLFPGGCGGAGDDRSICEAEAGECARRAGSGYGQRDDQMGYAAGLTDEI